jgi:hypothetical protein
MFVGSETEVITHLGPVWPARAEEALNKLAATSATTINCKRV